MYLLAVFKTLIYFIYFNLTNWHKHFILRKPSFILRLEMCLEFLLRLFVSFLFSRPTSRLRLYLMNSRLFTETDFIEFIHYK